MSYRSNLTDKAQSELEQATFEGGIPVFADATTKVVRKGADGMAERVTYDVNIRKNAGVIMSANDKPNVFEQPGK